MLWWIPYETIAIYFWPNSKLPHWDRLRISRYEFSFWKSQYASNILWLLMRSLLCTIPTSLWPCSFYGASHYCEFDPCSNTLEVGPWWEGLVKIAYTWYPPYNTYHVHPMTWSEACNKTNPSLFNVILIYGFTTIPRVINHKYYKRTHCTKKDI